MYDTIPATKAKNNFGELLKHVYRSGEPVVIVKDGLPVVVISPFANWDLKSNGKGKAKVKSRGNPLTE